MFSGDPFGDIFGQLHRQHMREMDQMMNNMMDPFGMLNNRGLYGGMLEDVPQRHPVHRGNMALMNPFSGGFFGGMMSQMEDMQARAMNDPNSHVFSQSTMVTFDGRQPRVVENSVRKTGEVKETRHAIRTGEHGVGDKLTISHSIGDRTHVIEKKRNRDGKIRERQSFVNLEQDKAEDFDREFTNRAFRNMKGGGSSKHKAIEDRTGSGSSYGNRSAHSRIGASGANAPIITLPDDEEEDILPTRSARGSSARGGKSGATDGPMIREVSDDDDHYEAGNHKRRKGAFDRLFKANDE